MVVGDSTGPPWRDGYVILPGRNSSRFDAGKSVYFLVTDRFARSGENKDQIDVFGPFLSEGRSKKGICSLQPRDETQGNFKKHTTT
jgi:hypothetical protein